MPSEQEIAWAAGFIDGEGCITISRRSPNGHTKSVIHQGVLMVANNHLPSLEHLRDIFGVGSIQRTGVRGWTWHVYSGDAKSVIESVMPYLVTKRTEAEIIMEYFNLPAQYRSLDESYIEKREQFCVMLKAEKNKRNTKQRK